MPLPVYFEAAQISRPEVLGGEHWQLTALRPIIVLFGKNGSGKSLLLRAWRDMEGAPAAGFARLDGDKSLPTPSTVPQKHIRFVKLRCHEAENLYLTDEVLHLFDTDWTTAASKIVAASAKHGDKALRLASAQTWDRLNENIKDLINEISSAIDPKSVHWTQRVGVAIGRAKPTGQLAQFLGADVINALWG